MAEYLIQGETLTAIADKIRYFTSSEARIFPNNMTDGIDSVYDAGYAKGYEAGSLKTCMTWELSNPTAKLTKTYNINFISNSVEYAGFSVTQSYNAATSRYIYIISYIKADNTATTAYNGSSWTNTAYKTISIVGGTDAADSTLLTFLNTHGTLKF